MDWLDRGLLVAATTAVVLTIRHLAHTIEVARLDQSVPPIVAPPEIGSVEAAEGAERIWSDDVLAEEEMEHRKTQGASAHSFDPCAWWDEEDERQASDEAARRTLRLVRRSP